MGELIEILPDTIQATSGNPPAVVGAGDAAKLADTTDTTYLQFTAAAQFIRVSFADYVLPSTKRILSVWAHVKRRVTGVTESRLGPVGVTTGTHLDALSGSYPAGQAAWIDAIVHYKDWNNAEWTNAQINALHYYTRQTSAPDANGRREYRATLQAWLITQPAAVVTSPAANKVGVSRGPLVGWYFVGLGEPQWKYRVKIFTQAVAENAAFNAENDASVYDSGWITSSATSHQVPANTLAVGTIYYVAIRVQKDMNVNGVQTGLAPYFSDWSAASKFTTNTAPVVDVTGPASPVNTTNRPRVTWTITDPEGDLQVGYQVRVFTAAQYGIGGFNPATSPATHDSGMISSADAEYRIPINLANGTWRAYVKVQAQPPGALFGADVQESAWDYQQFDVNVVAPLNPTIDAVANLVNARVDITFNKNAAGVVPEFYDLMRSVDGGAFEFIRGGEKIPYVAGAMLLSDNEAPFNVPITYRVIAYDQTVDDLIASASVDDVVTLAVGESWLKNPMDSADNMMFYSADSWMARGRPKLRTIHAPIGRLKPLVVRGEVDTQTFAMTYTILGQDRYEDLYELLNAETVLLHQTAKESVYVEVMDVQENEHLFDELRGEEPAWQITVSYLEVEAP